MTDLSLDGLTQETVDLITKAATSGLLASTGVYGVDLSGLVSLVPVNTPFRNATARTVAPEGAKNATWRALLDVNNTQPNVAVGYDYAGSLLQLEEQDVFAPFVPFAISSRVTQDAVDLAKSYADAKAVATLQALNQLMIGEDKFMIGGQAYSLGTPATPNVTTSTSGGSIGATTAVNVKVAARSGMNYFYGGSTAASAQGSVTTGAGSSNSATATVTALPGAVAYDWFVGGEYYTTTTVNTVTITAIPGSPDPLPALPGLSSVAPTTPPATDSSYSANSYNGVIASVLGDYGTGGQVQRGTATSSGSYFSSLDGGTLTLNGAAIAQLDAMNLAIWNSVHLSPTAYMMNAQEAEDITNKVIGTSAAYTLLPVDSNAGRANIAAGGFVNQYLNKATGGTPIAIEVHPHVPPGTIIARTDKVPFPGANIGNVFEVECLRDYSTFEYGANLVTGQAGGGPRSDSEVRVLSAFKCKAPVACGVLSNIAAG